MANFFGTLMLAFSSRHTAFLLRSVAQISLWSSLSAVMHSKVVSKVRTDNQSSLPLCVVVCVSSLCSACGRVCVCDQSGSVWFVYVCDQREREREEAESRESLGVELCWFTPHGLGVRTLVILLLATKFFCGVSASNTNHTFCIPRISAVL